MATTFPTFYADLYSDCTLIVKRADSLRAELAKAPYSLQLQLLEITQQSCGTFAKLVAELPRYHQQGDRHYLRSYLLKDMRSPLSTAISSLVLMGDIANDPSSGALSDTQKHVVLEINKTAQRALEQIESFADTLM